MGKKGREKVLWKKDVDIARLGVIVNTLNFLSNR